jgi:hypothetical protein
MKHRWGFRIVKFAGFALVAGLALALLVMFLWNALVPELFHGPAVGFAQALGLLILSHILFRGPGRWGGGWRHERWRRRMDDMMASMTPEDRDKFRAEWRHGCGHRSGEETSQGDAS